NTIMVCRIAIREATLHTRVSLVGMTFAIGRHTHNFDVWIFSLDFGLEAAADTAISAGCRDCALRLTKADDRFFGERRGRTGLNTRSTRNTLGIEERLVLAGRHLRVKSARLDSKRERTLNFIARAHAARTDDAQLGVESEVRIAFVLRH